MQMLMPKGRAFGFSLPAAIFNQAAKGEEKMEKPDIAKYENYIPPVMCFSCEHFAPDMSRRYPSARRGECRRSAPNLGVEAVGAWPTVSEFDWCGDGISRIPD